VSGMYVRISTAPPNKRARALTVKKIISYFASFCCPAFTIFFLVNTIIKMRQLLRKFVYCKEELYAFSTRISVHFLLLFLSFAYWARINV
jgi:hypothetical protein